MEQRLGYQYSDLELLRQALTHRSVGAENNERLEFLGDSILNLCITQELYDLRPEANEGELSRMRASLVNRDALAGIANQLELSSFIQLGQGERRSGGQRRESIQSDTVEAIFGSIFMDGGYEQCRSLILRLYASQLDNLPDAEALKDPKTRLQELLQSQGQGLPEYQIILETGKDHEKRFEVNCLVAGNEVSTGQGNSRRKAEQAAAEKALTQLLNQ